MDALELANTLAEQLNSMTRAQYLILAFALRQIGGEMTVGTETFTRASGGELPPLEISVVGEELLFRFAAVTEQA